MALAFAEIGHGRIAWLKLFGCIVRAEFVASLLLLSSSLQVPRVVALLITGIVKLEMGRIKDTVKSEGWMKA